MTYYFPDPIKNAAESVGLYLLVYFKHIGYWSFVITLLLGAIIGLYLIIQPLLFSQIHNREGIKNCFTWIHTSNSHHYINNKDRFLAVLTMSFSIFLLPNVLFFFVANVRHGISSTNLFLNLTGMLLLIGILFGNILLFLFTLNTLIYREVVRVSHDTITQIKKHIGFQRHQSIPLEDCHCIKVGLSEYRSNLGTYHQWHAYVKDSKTDTEIILFKSTLLPADENFISENTLHVPSSILRELNELKSILNIEKLVGEYLHDSWREESLESNELVIAERMPAK